MDQANDLRALVRQVASASTRCAGAPPIAARPRRIVVFGGKGGVGTTTIAVNLGVALAQQGERCLLCDAAGGDVALQLRLEPRFTLAEVLKEYRTADEALMPGPAGMQILPGTRELVRPHDAAEHAWNRLLAQLPSLAYRPQAIVVDAGNRPDALARQLWQAADRVLLVSTEETAAIMDAYATIKLLNDPARSASIALLLNRVCGDPGPASGYPGTPVADEAQRRLVHACRRFLGLPLRSIGVVLEDTHVPQCAARGEAFLLAAPACAASLGLRQAARALTNHVAARRPVAA